MPIWVLLVVVIVVVGAIAAAVVIAGGGGPGASSPEAAAEEFFAAAEDGDAEKMKENSIFHFDDSASTDDMFSTGNGSMDYDDVDIKILNTKNIPKSSMTGNQKNITEMMMAGLEDELEIDITDYALVEVRMKVTYEGETFTYDWDWAMFEVDGRWYLGAPVIDFEDIDLSDYGL